MKNPTGYVEIDGVAYDKHKKTVFKYEPYINIHEFIDKCLVIRD